jgi:hypothetical protein
VEAAGRIAFGSKVAVGPFGKGVSVGRRFGVGVSPAEKGWKGVRVGVALAGAVTRNKSVGVAAGSKGVAPGEIVQPVMKRMTTTAKRVRLMPFLLEVGGCAGKYPARIIGRTPHFLVLDNI